MFFWRPGLRAREIRVKSEERNAKLEGESKRQPTTLKSRKRKLVYQFSKLPLGKFQNETHQFVAANEG